MLVLRGVEKICRNELTLPARLGRQDKSNGTMRRLSHCLHIQELATLARYIALQGALAARALPEARPHAPLGSVAQKIPQSRCQ